jgi:sulfate adenylyltransferase
MTLLPSGDCAHRAPWIARPAAESQNRSIPNECRELDPLGADRWITCDCCPIAPRGPLISGTTTTLPDVGVAAHLVPDVELALLGVLPDGQRLGAPVQATPSSPSGSTVSMSLPPGIAKQVRQAGSAVLRDEEWTPFARLLVTDDLSAPAADDVVLGKLEPFGGREAGLRRHDALTAGDRGSYAGAHVVLLRRLPLGDERHRLEVGRAGTGRLLLLVPSGPGTDRDVPPAVLVKAADALAAGSSSVSVRVVPISWRDPASDRAVVARLAQWLGADSVDYLDPDGDDEWGAQWRRTLSALDGVDGELDVDPETASYLRAWRPARSARGLVLMFTGLSGSGKSTVARAVAERVKAAGRTVTLLDGDVVRTFLSAGLGFDRQSRERNVERIGFVAAEVARHGGVAICAPIAPYRSSREVVRSLARQHGDFVLVHVSTPLEECERRDVKGLYAKARAGLITEFTGISDPYETPDDPDLALDTSTMPTSEAVRRVMDLLTRGGWLPAGPS